MFLSDIIYIACFNVNRQSFINLEKRHNDKSVWISLNFFAFSQLQSKVTEDDRSVVPSGQDNLYHS